MDKIKANYTKQTEFPLDEETLDYIQNNQSLIEMLGNIAGDKVILSGCALYSNGTMRQSGYVFVRTTDFPQGEVLPFTGGSVSAGMYVKKASIDVTANNTTYIGAYTKRTLEPGIGGENFNWNDFSDLHTTKSLKALCVSLQEQINLLTPPPIGIVQLWAGSVANIPNNYALCDGRALLQTQYQDLYAVIGNTFNTKKNYNGASQTTATGMFRLPDLRGRFIVGYNETANDSDYGAIGNTGGEKRHTLTAAESGLPAHTHKYDKYDPSSGNWFDNGRNTTKHWDSLESSNPIINGVQYPSGKNADVAHENRPPYYVLAYIMRIK